MPLSLEPLLFNPQLEPLLVDDFRTKAMHPFISSAPPLNRSRSPDPLWVWGEWIHVLIQLSPSVHYLALFVNQLYPIQNRKLKKNSDPCTSALLSLAQSTTNLHLLFLISLFLFTWILAPEHFNHPCSFNFEVDGRVNCKKITMGWCRHPLAPQFFWKAALSSAYLCIRAPALQFCLPFPVTFCNNPLYLWETLREMQMPLPYACLMTNLSTKTACGWIRVIQPRSGPSEAEATLYLGSSGWCVEQLMKLSLHRKPVLLPLISLLHPLQRNPSPDQPSSKAAWTSPIPAQQHQWR